jgi:putative peptidoglycan lipid II flippase
VPGKLELTTQLTRIMLPFLPLVTVAAAMMGMLNSLHHYFVPAAAPAMFNVATIVCAVALVPVAVKLGQPPIIAVALGALLGGIGQVALQIPPLRREGWRYRPVLDGADAGLRRVLLLMGPGTVGLAATQVNLFVATLLATTQGTGAVSWLTYAFRLMYLPIGLFGVSIATAVLPAAAEHAAADDEAAIRATVSRGLGLMLVLNVPATIGLMVLATPIVRLLFERGQFLPADTLPTAAALCFYAPGLIGYSAARITGPVFYALGHSRVPVVVSMASVGINIAASIVLVRMMGFVGLALATSLAALANAGILLWLLRRRLGGMDGRFLTITTAKAASAGACMGWIASASERQLTVWIPGEAAAIQCARLALAIGAGLMTLLTASKVLKVRELDAALSEIQRQVRKLLTG